MSDWTIRTILKWTTDYFQQKGIDSPRLTAEYLLAYALGVSRVELYLSYDKPLMPLERERFKSLIKRRLNHEPLAYIVGKQPFWLLDLEVNCQVLIPRPETERLVEVCLDVIKQNALNCPFILDWGTGSGAIALALAKELPEVHIVACDISLAALKVAQKNALNHQLAISLVNSDGLSAFKENCFDIIVSNPPYVKSEDIAHLAPEIKDYEPLEALDGGPDGLKFIRKLITEGSKYLKSPGFLILEIGYGQSDAVKELVNKLTNWRQYQIIKDYAGIDRVVLLTK